MTIKYRVVLVGLAETEEQFTLGMCSRFGIASATVKHIIAGAPVVLKKDLNLREAREYAEAIQIAGGKVQIQECGESQEPEREHNSLEIKSFSDFTLCPECGFTQLKSEACVKCGFPFSPERESRNQGRDRGR